jgi:hypothetical protein
MKHAILFLAANPIGTSRLTVDREASTIQSELARGGSRDSFVLVTRWAAEPLDLLRELRKVKPTIVHFSGHAGGYSSKVAEARSASRDVALVADDPFEGDGLLFEGVDGSPQVVSAAALTETIVAAGASVRLVVLNACSSELHTRLLLSHVDCVVSAVGSISDAAARSFSAGFYGGLAECASIAAAFQQGRAAIRLAGLRNRDDLQLQVRDGINPNTVVLASPCRRSRRVCKSC